MMDVEIGTRYLFLYVFVFLWFGLGLVAGEGEQWEKGRRGEGEVGVYGLICVFFYMWKKVGFSVHVGMEESVV